MVLVSTRLAMSWWYACKSWAGQTFNETSSPIDLICMFSPIGDFWSITRCWYDVWLPHFWTCEAFEPRLPAQTTAWLVYSAYINFLVRHQLFYSLSGVGRYRICGIVNAYCEVKFWSLLLSFIFLLYSSFPLYLSNTKILILSYWFLIESYWLILV